MSGDPLDSTDRVVIVGASLAGLRAAETLRANGFTGPVTLVGDEQHPPYDRPPLSKQLLSGQWPESRLSLVAGRGLDDFTWWLGRRANALDPEAATVTLDDGDTLTYDALVIATGVRPRPLDPRVATPGDHLHTLRTLDDAARLAPRLTRRVVVIGAGFIGCEVASTAAKLGAEVTVVEPGPGPMRRSLGVRVGEHMAREIRLAGVDLRLGTAVVAVERTEDGRAAVALDDGATLRADCVVVGIGAQPNTEWLTGSGLVVDDGVVCDDRLFAADRVVAAGDVARWLSTELGRTLRHEHWTSAVAQADLAATNLLAGRAAARPYVEQPYVWSDQFGLRIEVLGRPDRADHDEVVWGTLEEGRFVVGYRDPQGHLTGFVGVNAMRPFLALRKRVRMSPVLDDELAAAAGFASTAIGP